MPTCIYCEIREATAGAPHSWHCLWCKQYTYKLFPVCTVCAGVQPEKRRFPSHTHHICEECAEEEL